MKQQDILSIIATFVTGIFFGGYLYLTNAAALVAEIQTPDVTEASEFVIVADAYGGCRDLCPSFQVTHDGTYRYLYVPRGGGEKIIRQGQLPNELRSRLLAVVTSTELRKQSKTIEPAFCQSYTDGIDVVYEIELDGVTYSLDSCGTAVEANSALWKVLGGIWTYLERGGNNS